MLPAGTGDCFLVQLGEIFILIDTGHKSTYNLALRPRLQELAHQGKHLSHMILTHADYDRIGGAIQLLEDNGTNEDSRIIPIDQVWHNGYMHLGELPDSPSDIFEKHIDQDPTIGLSRSENKLTRLLVKGGYKLNTDFKGEAIKVNNPINVSVGKDVFFTIFTPTDYEMELMASKLGGSYSDSLNRDMEGEEEDFEEAQEAFKAIPDRNSISISFLLEYKELKMLFLADVPPAPIIRQLKKAFPSISKDNPLVVDVLKVSKIGSRNYNPPELFELIAAKNYLISGNGKRYNLPHGETIDRIIRSHPKTPKKLVFNHLHDFLKEEKTSLSSDFSNLFLDEELMDIFNYQFDLPDEEGYKVLEL